MRIATFNVNSIRARMPRFLEWLDEAQPDIAVLQETKVEDAKFPFEDMAATGYEIKIHGQQRYNGVAVLSKKPVTDIHHGFEDSNWPNDARIIRFTHDDVHIINTYVPNGTQVGIDKWDYKMAWLERLRQLCDDIASTSDKVIWLGDINIAPTSDDVFEAEKKLGNVGHHPEEFDRLKKILDWGWTDCFRQLTAGAGHYTYWDFRIPNSVPRKLGWRIDHVYASEALKDACTKCWTDEQVRTKERPSDHAPVLAEFDL